MTSTAPFPADTDDPPVRHAVRATLQLAGRLEEAAGWRAAAGWHAADLLYGEAASIRQDIGGIDATEADPEMVRRGCLSLVSQTMTAVAAAPEAKAECWITLAELHELADEQTDFRGRAARSLLAALEDIERAEPTRAGQWFSKRRGNWLPRRARLLLRLAEQRAAEGRWNEATSFAEKAYGAFVEAREPVWAEKCRLLAELAKHNLSSTTAGGGGAGTTRTVVQRLRPTPDASADRSTGSSQGAADPVTSGDSLRSTRRVPLTSADPLAAIHDLRALPLNEMCEIDGTRRRTAGITLSKTERARLDAASALAGIALKQTEIGNHADALLLYAMTRPLWTGIAGAELARAACSHGLSTTYTALGRSIEADAAAQTARGLVNTVPDGEPYQGACLTRVDDLRSIVETHYPRLDDGEADPAMTADMLLELTEYSFRLAHDEHHDADLDADVLRSTMKMAHRARFRLEPGAVWTSAAKVKLARCDFILGTCMVLAVGHGHPVGGLPVQAEDAWASFLASDVLAEAGADGGRDADDGENGSGRGDGRRRRTGAADLNARCAAIVPLMAGLDAFAAVSGRSAVLKDSLEIFLNATMKAVAA